MSGTAILRPVRSLRVRLALLYSALFCVSAVALGAVAEVFEPNFLVHRASRAAPPPFDACAHRVVITAPVTHSSACVPLSTPGGQSFLATVIHDASQNKAGVAIVVLMVALALGGGWLLAGRMLRPLRTITSSARAISASNLNQRLPIDGPADEFTELGGTLNDLFGRLEASFEAQRRFVANASHELRTPLAAGRTVLQVALADPASEPQALRSACQEAIDLGDQQDRLIDALLTLATSERGIEEWQPFDLAEIASKVILDRRDEVDRLSVRVGTALSAAPATGDARLAESLVANLVDNALRHNLPGGEMDIATAIVDGRAVLSVTNTGRPIPPGDVDRLFQPFQRLGSDRVRPTSAARPGHGLGLAIVRAIAGAHDATITAHARPGGGLEIEVAFP
jgi:signal transduction histidine kinase